MTDHEFRETVSTMLQNIAEGQTDMELLEEQWNKEMEKRFGKSDPVKHPAHYAGEIETIDYIRDKLTGNQFVGYCIGNVIKYVSRYQKKGEPAQDLEKAAVYLGWAVKAQKKLEE